MKGGEFLTLHSSLFTSFVEASGIEPPFSAKHYRAVITMRPALHLPPDCRERCPARARLSGLSS